MRLRAIDQIYCRLVFDVLGVPNLGCEVGVSSGRLSRALLCSFLELRMIMIDPYREYDRGWGQIVPQKEMDKQFRLARTRTNWAADRRVQILGDSLEVVYLLKSRSLDFVFLDADHTYGSMKRGLPAWWSKLRKGGLLSGHDYGGAGDKRGKFGVKRSVDEFAEEKGLKANRAPRRMWWIKKET